MEEKHRNILRRHRSSIRMDLEPENILANLVEILNDTDEGEIKAQPTREKRCDKLLDILPRKGPNAFIVFVEALKREAVHLASDLIEAGNKEELINHRLSVIEVLIKWHKDKLIFHHNAILAEYSFILFSPNQMKCQFYTKTNSQGIKLVDQRHFCHKFYPEFCNY